MTDRSEQPEPAALRADRLAALNASLRDDLDRARARRSRDERDIERLTDQVKALTARLAKAENEQAWKSYRTDYVTWQLESARLTRWARLGAALTMIRRGRPGGPAAVARSMRSAPRPQEPRRPETAEALPAGPADTVEIDPPAVTLPDGPIARPELTVAAIMDTFTATALRYEWRQIDGFGPDDWREVLAAEAPGLLFVESAWSGNGGRWRDHLGAAGAPSDAVRALVAWCRERGVPTVFWNKEDPPNFDLFIESAKLFDRVFTVDAGSVERYREILGHDRIGVLPFGAQPRVHNPMRVPDQGRHEVAFAGTYYNEKHPGRREQFETVVAPALRFGLHIFSRVNQGDTRYAFPPAYRPHIVGTLPYERMLAAQKLYKVILNVNSVADSDTMCARRVFELSAAGLPVVSGPGRAVAATFGELVPTVTTQEETVAVLGALLRSDELRDRRAHLAMRKALSEHTYGHRVDTVLSALGLPVRRTRPSVSVVLPTCRPGQISHAIEQVARQTWRPLQLVMVLHGLDVEPSVVEEKARAAGIEDVVVLAADRSVSLGGCLNLGVAAADGEFVGKMDDDELYGPHYLSDLMLTFGYTEAEITGKLAHYVHLRSTGATMLRFGDHEHRYVRFLRGGAFLARAGLLRSYPFPEVARGEDTRLFRALDGDGVKIYAADRYSFVTVRAADAAGHTWAATERDLMAQGRIVFYGPPHEHVLV